MEILFKITTLFNEEEAIFLKILFYHITNTIWTIPQSIVILWVDVQQEGLQEDKKLCIIATSQRSSFTVNKQKSEVQIRCWIAMSVVMLEFTPRLRGDFNYSIAYVFCSNMLATL